MESRRECRHLRFQSPTARQRKLQNCCNRIIFSLGYERLSGGRLTAKRTFVRQPATAGVLRSGDLCVFDDDGAVVFAAAVTLPTNTPFPWFCVAATHTKTPSKKKGQEIRSQVPPATHVSQPRCCPPRPSPAVSATCRLHGSRLRSGCSADSKRKGLLRTTTPHHYDSALRPVNVLVRYVQFRGY